MGLVLSAAAALCLWIVLWSINVSGFDAMLVVVIIVVVAIGVHNILPYLPGRRD